MVSNFDDGCWWAHLFALCHLCVSAFLQVASVQALLTDEQMEASVLSFQPLTLALTPPRRIGLSTIFQGLLVIFSRPSNYLHKPIKYLLKHSLKHNIRQPTFTVPTSSSTTYPPCSAVMYVYKLRMHHVGISPFVNGQFPSQPPFFPLVCICSFLLLICCVILFEGKTIL